MRQFSELLVKLLDYCEMHCVMCGQLSQAGRRAVLSLENLREYFRNHTFVGKRVYLWGGEPLLHPELDQIISFFKEKGALVAMNTNGYKLDRHIDRLIASGLDRIIFSMDGSDAITHDSIRGVPGSFDKLVANINLVHTTALTPLIRINFVVLPLNYKQVLKVIDWSSRNGVYRMHFQLPIFLTPAQLNAYANIVRTECGCAARNYGAFVMKFDGVDFSALEQIMQTVYERHRDFARFYPFERLNASDLRTYFTTDNSLKDCRCDVLEEKLAIDASGRFVTCPDFPDISYGNLAGGMTNPERLDWLRERFMTGERLPICNRCCHFVPHH
ncbi:MAG TPA: radical SAM protein [Pyrinomonadaceae bacterium]|nr:radical SAM protein [Pyrinomonadaceae bacterium]